MTGLITFKLAPEVEVARYQNYVATPSIFDSLVSYIL